MVLSIDIKMALYAINLCGKQDIGALGLEIISRCRYAVKPMFASPKIRAAMFIFAAVIVATAQDAIVKGLASGYPTWEAVAFRGATATPLFIAWAYAAGLKPFHLPPLWRLILLRATILFSAYMCFALSIAILPLANAVAIYFTMPIFVGLMSSHSLGEKVPAQRWLAIAIGFLGVLISVRPGHETFQPAALLALYAAFGYAWGQILSRRISQTVEPLIIANAQSLFYLGGAGLIGLLVTGLKLDASGWPTFATMTKVAMWPTLPDFGLMLVMGIFSCISSVFFVKAYQVAPASFVAPLEYSGIISAVIYGFVFFNEWPDFYTLMGAGVVICAGLLMMAETQKN